MLLLIRPASSCDLETVKGSPYLSQSEIRFNYGWTCAELYLDMAINAAIDSDVPSSSTLFLAETSSSIVAQTFCCLERCRDIF